jgi:Second Messenger Oligonucleotide or Dinucleotide Synthetase domain
MGGSGGSGGRSYFRERKPEDVKLDLRKEEERTLDQAFDVQVAERIGKLLSDANQRDTKAIRDAIEEIKAGLGSDIEGTIDLIFGGSIRKRTYVDGISDIDTLFILRDPKLKSLSPQQVLAYFEQEARKKLSGWETSKGNLAITFRKAGLEIQVLPAVNEDGKTHIPSTRGDRWSDIDPQKFFRKLTDTNDKLGGKVVPVIKLVKIINFQQPEALQLAGYHVESLAIEAFKGYSGPLNPKAMLEHFFDKSRALVLAPIQDKTGQSVHVDADLGAANSNNRKEVSAALDRIHRRMKNADALRSEDQWLEPFGDDQ